MHDMSQRLNVDCEFKLGSPQPLHLEFRCQPKPVTDEGARCPGMNPGSDFFSSWLLSVLRHKSGIPMAPTWIHRGCCNSTCHKESPAMSAGRNISINHGNDSGVQSPISCLLFNVSLLVLLNDECPQPPSTIQGESPTQEDPTLWSPTGQSLHLADCYQPLLRIHQHQRFQLYP